MDDLKWYKKPEMIVAYSALLISFVTAIISVYSAYVDRTNARVSVWPRVEIFRNYGNSFFEYELKNSGNGPALIKYTLVNYKSTPIKSWQEIPKLPAFTQTHIGTRILSPNSKVKPIEYKGTESVTLYEAAKFIDINICYCSIYDDCWLTNEENEHLPVDSCPIDELITFSQ
jgi:hypothetical protein